MTALSFRHCVCLFLVWLATCLPQAAAAQPAPDAGAIRQQIEGQVRPALPPSADPLPAAPPAPLQLPEGATVTAVAFQFTGNTLLGDAALQPVVQGWLNRPLSFFDLQQAALAVAAAYRQAGWIVRAYLPTQDVTEGRITLHVIEARFAGAQLEGEAPERIDPDLALRMVQAQQPTGEPLRADALDRALLLIDDLPGVSATAALTPGEQDGQTGLALRLRDGPVAQAEAGIDNTGARSTGSRRATLAATLHSPLRLGDSLRADLLHSSGTDYARVAWSLPVGSDGWRIGLNASLLRYDVVAPEFAALGAKGSSASVGADARWPLLRSRLRNLYVSVAADDKRFHNQANGATQSRYGVRSLSMGLAGNLYDSLAGGGANQYSLTWTRGRLNLGQPDPGETAAGGGSFGKLRYAASRQQQLTATLSFYGSWSGQTGSRQLDSSERFYLGGPTGVRAYPANEGSGSQGQLMTAELQWRALPSLAVSGFYDRGSATAAGPTGAVRTVRTVLRGYGAAVAWSGPQGLELKATWARRDGHNPQAQATTGRDQDGSLHRHRIWLQASVRF